MELPIEANALGTAHLSARLTLIDQNDCFFAESQQLKGTEEMRPGKAEKARGI